MQTGVAHDPISLAFCISDSYAQHAAVVIASALRNNPNEVLEFHILSGDLSPTTKERLSQMESDRCHLFFYDVDRSAFDAFPTPQEYISQETYYRFLIPHLIPRDRIIYSDVDVLILRPLRPLWETNMGDHTLGAVKEYNEYYAPQSSKAQGWRSYKTAIGMNANHAYFYAGLLLMDCSALLRDHFTERCFKETETCTKTLSNDDFSATDQVVLNRLFENKMFELSPTWCITEAFKHICKEPISIRHFAGYYEKPWCNVCWNTTWFAYLYYLLKTPYRSNAKVFILKHLISLFYSSHVKKGWRRYFIFCFRVYKKRV